MKSVFEKYGEGEKKGQDFNSGLKKYADMLPEKERPGFYQLINEVINTAQASPLATIFASNYVPEQAIKKLQTELAVAAAQE